MPYRIHLFGASGSGTTTLGKALAAQLEVPYFDTDDFFWLPSNPPFTRVRLLPERLELLRAQIAPHDSWVLSGSLCGWGDPLIPEFTVAVFVSLDPRIRNAL